MPTNTKRIRITNESLNCYGVWIKTDGVDTTQYERNPVLLWMHQRGVVIGMIKDIRNENGEITGEPWFDEVRPESRMAKEQWEKGTLRMGSPNFQVLETSEDASLMKPGQTGPTITKCRLIEYSMVDIGGNDDNIRLSYGNEQDYSNFLKPKSMNELKTIALMLGLSENATLKEVQQQVTVLLSFQKQATDLQQELNSTKTQLETLQLSGITEMVDGAIAAGKIDATRKNQFIELGKQVGAESLKLTFDAMYTAVKPSMVLNRPAAQTTGEYKKLSEVPVNELKLMRQQDPNTYRRLYKAEYGIECPELDA